MRVERRLVVVFAALVAGITAAADDLRPRVILSWETRDANGMSTSRLRQNIDVFLSRALTETIALDMVVGANHYDQSAEIESRTTKMRVLELRPSGNLRADFGPVATQTNWTMRRSRSELDGIRSNRSNEQMGTNVAWASSKVAPGGSFRAMRYRIDDRDAGRAFLNDQLAASLNYQWSGLTVTAGRAYRGESDSRGGYERRTTDTTAGLSYADAFARGKLSVTASANGTQSSVDDAAETGSRIPTYVTGARVLWAVDDTPLDSSDHPLVPYPTLSDGRTDVATDLDLGPDSASFQAFAFDFGRVSPVDEIQIVVRDERNEEVTNPAGVRFDVYMSIDGVRWTPHAAGVDVTFDSVRSLYEVAFDSVDTQWVKVVTFGSTGRPVFVTEVLALFHRIVGANANDSEYRTVSSNAAVFFTPIRPVTLGYTGSTYRSEQKSGESLQSDVFDVLHVFSARYDPRGWFGYEARYETHDVETDRDRQGTNAIVGSIRFSPRPQLTTTVQCDRREEMTDDALIEGRTCSANLSARVFSTLDFTAGASKRHQAISTGGTQDTDSLWVSSNARVTRSLRVLVAAAMNRGAYDGWSGPVAPLTRDDRYTAEVDWVGGRALGLGATLTWVRTPNFSGLLQRYRIRWSPFGDGSVSLITNYTQDVDPYTDSRSERVLISPRWQINSRAALNLTYSSVSNTGEQSFQSDSLLAALILGR